MKPAHKMRPAFPAFLAPRGATPFDTDLAELGCQRPTAFALGEDRVGRLSAGAVFDKFLASVRARAPARKRPFDVEAPSLTRNCRPIDAYASKRYFPFVRGGRLAISLDRSTVTRFAPRPIYNDSARGLMRLEELDVALVGRAAVARNGVVRGLNGRGAPSRRRR